jgi:hypothetical protein
VVSSFLQAMIQNQIAKIGISFFIKIQIKALSDKTERAVFEDIITSLDFA